MHLEENDEWKVPSDSRYVVPNGMEKTGNEGGDSRFLRNVNSSLTTLRLLNFIKKFFFSINS